jgi:regulatory protein
MSETKRQTRHPVKIPTPQRLKNIALYYLSRYAASETSLRRMLQRRMLRAKSAHPDFTNDHEKQAELNQTIEQIIEAHKKTGAVNDAAIAEMKIAGLRRSGRSEKFIHQKLTQRGLEKTLVTTKLREHDANETDETDESAESKAALIYAKRRRLGPFRPPDRRKETDPRKDFATLARAGFRSAIIGKILHTPCDENEPEDL